MVSINNDGDVNSSVGVKKNECKKRKEPLSCRCKEANVPNVESVPIVVVIVMQHSV